MSFICQECFHTTKPGEFHDMNVCLKNKSKLKMGNLPEWIEKQTESYIPGTPGYRLKEALAIAWEALDQIATHLPDDWKNTKDVKDTMRRIRELGQ